MSDQLDMFRHGPAYGQAMDIPIVPDASVAPGTVEIRQDGVTVGTITGLGPGPHEEFLTGLLATWLAGEGKPTKAQRARAERAARAALDALEGRTP